MQNIQQSKNTVLISNISIITFLNFAFYTLAASLLASRGLEAVLQEAKAKTHKAEARAHEAEAKTHKTEARFFGLEAEARPQGLTSLHQMMRIFSQHHKYQYTFMLLLGL